MGIRLFNVALWWPHSSLRVSIWMTLDISPKECPQLHCVERYSEPLLEEIIVLQAWACVNQADWSRVLFVLVEAQSRHSCCAFCAPARVCLSVCCSQFSSCTWHALTIHIDPSVPSSLKSFHSHCPSILPPAFHLPLPWCRGLQPLALPLRSWVTRTERTPPQVTSPTTTSSQRLMSSSPRSPWPSNGSLKTSTTMTYHRSDAPQCVPKTSRSLWRRRPVVLSVVVVNESW